jgi:hypothetical protein
MKLRQSAKVRFESANFLRNVANATGGPAAFLEGGVPSSLTAVWLIFARFTGADATQQDKLFVALDGTSAAVYSQSDSFMRVYNRASQQAEGPQSEELAAKVPGFLSEEEAVPIIEVLLGCFNLVLDPHAQRTFCMLAQVRCMQCTYA